VLPFHVHVQALRQQLHDHAHADGGREAHFLRQQCDRYDAALARQKTETAFDDREKLLFREHKPILAKGPPWAFPAPCSSTTTPRCSSAI